MRAGLLLSIFLAFLASCFAAPIPYAESLRKLEELSGKLEELEKTLKRFEAEVAKEAEFSPSIRDLSPEDQALLDKHKSMQSAIDATLAKGEHTAENEDAEIPQVNRKRELALQQAYRQLSPEDQALINKYKSKQPFIDVEMLKKNPEGPEETETQRRESQLEQVYRQLSPDEQALLQKYKSKQSQIDAALLKPSTSAEVEGPEVEPETEEERRQNKLHQVYRNLSPEEQALLAKHKSKQSTIDAVLLAEHNTAEDAADDAAEETVEERNANSYVDDYIMSLSDENQQLLRRMKSKLPYLQHALEKKARKDKLSNRGITPLENVALVSRNEDEDKLAQFEQSLSPEDLELLKHFKSKLHYLKEALNAKKPVEADEEEASEPDAEAVPGADAGPLEDRSEAKMDGWNEQPIAESDLGLQEKCACDKQSSKRCACDKDLAERCPRCHQNDAIIKLLEEKCPTCGGNKTPDQVLEDVESRLLKDLAYARENGISVSQIIERIKAREVANEEDQLELLDKAN